MDLLMMMMMMMCACVCLCTEQSFVELSDVKHASLGDLANTSGITVSGL